MAQGATTDPGTARHYYPRSEVEWEGSENPAAQRRDPSVGFDDSVSTAPQGDIPGVSLDLDAPPEHSPQLFTVREHMPHIDRYTLSRILSGRRQELDLESFSSADWHALLHRARAEGVGPLLYRALSGTGAISSLPKPVTNSLRAMYFSTRMDNEQLIKELETLTRLFDQAGIPTVALKGICFALTIYPDIGLRPMTDLDLLVPAARLSEALDIAKASGYVQAVPEASPGSDDLFNHAACLKKNVAPYTTLELHHTLLAEASFIHAVPVDWFWSQTEPMQPLFLQRTNGNLRMLAPTAQVLYACAHAMLQHGARNTSLRWLYDLDRLIRVYAERERLDWDLLLSQARKFEWSSAVYAALTSVIDFFDTPVPQKVLDDLATHADRNMERVLTLQARPGTHTLEEYQKLRSLNGYGRFKLILALVAPTPAYMRWRYGLKTYWSLPAWYLYRWWGIFKDGIRTARLILQNSRLTSHVEQSREKPII